MADKSITLGTIFTADISDFKANVKGAKVALESLGKTMVGVSTTSTKATVATKGVATAHKTAAKAADASAKKHLAFNKQISKVSGAMERLKAAMKVTASYGIAARAIFGIYEAAAAGTKEIIDFDQALKNLQAISGASDVQIGVMGETIKTVARTTKFSTVEVADGMVLLTQAGFSAAEAMSAIQATANLATGTLTRMATTSDLLTSTIRAFGLQASEASRVADVMANAINRSKLTIDKLRISFNFIGAVAAQTGLSLEETAAAAMSLANSGIRASTIGTGMRNVLSRLVAPTAKLRDAFEEYGIELDKVNPATVGFASAMKTLAPILWDSEKGTVDMAKAFSLFGLRGSQAAAVLIKSFTTGGYDKMLSKVYEVGAAEAMAAIQAEGLGVKLKNMADRFKLAAIAIGEAGFAGVLGAVFDTLRSLATLMENLAKDIVLKQVVAWAAWTASILLTAKAITMAGGAIKTFYLWAGSTALLKEMQISFMAVNNLMLDLGRNAAGLKGAWAALLAGFAKSPIIFIAAAMGALAVVTGYFITKSKKAREELEKQVQGYDATVNSLTQYKNALDDLQKKMAKGEDVHEQYRATLQRLLKDHPELAAMVDITIDSYERLKEEIENLAFAEFQRGAKKQAEFIVKQSKYVDDLGKSYEHMKSYVDDVIDVWMDSAETGKELFEETAKGRVEIGKLNLSISGLLDKYIHFIDVEKLTRDEAKKQIKSFLESKGASDQLADSISNKLIPAYDHWLELQRKGVSGVGFKSILDKYRGFYEQLDAEQKGSFAAMLSTVTKQASNMEQALRKQLKGEVDLESIIAGHRADMFAKAISDWVVAEKKGIQSRNSARAESAAIMRKMVDDQKETNEQELNELAYSYIRQRGIIEAEMGKKVSLEGNTQADIERIKTTYNKKLENLDARYLKNDEAMRERHLGWAIGWQNRMTKALTPSVRGKSVLEKKLASDKKYFSALAAARDDDAMKLQENYNKQLAADKAWYAERIRHRRDYGETVEDIQKMYANLRDARNQKAFNDALKLEKKYDAQRIQMIRDAEISELEVRKQGAVGKRVATRALAREERILKLKYLNEDIEDQKKYIEQLKAQGNIKGKVIKDAELKLSALIKALGIERTNTEKANYADDIDELERHYAERLAVIQKYSTEWLSIQNKMAEQELVTDAELLERKKDYQKYWLGEIEKMWRSGAVATEVYSTAVQTAFDTAAISLEEYTQRMTAATGTWTTNLELGIERAKEKIQSFNELFQQFGMEFAGQFAGGMTDALWDFIDGTEKADMAFQNFARSMLRWISQMILKLTIMKVVMGIMGGLGGGGQQGAIGGAGAPYGRDVGMGFGYGFHKGGVVGVSPAPVRIVNPNIFSNARRFDTGGIVGAKEEPIIAHKGEGIFTEEQMKVLGNRTIELTTINVQDFKMLDRVLATSQGKNAMLNFLGSNAPILKRMIG